MIPKVFVLQITMIEINNLFVLLWGRSSIENKLLKDCELKEVIYVPFTDFCTFLSPLFEKFIIPS